MTTLRSAGALLAVAVVLALAGQAQAATISAGEAQSCGTSPAGAASCWGSNSGGSLGIGATRPSYSYDPLPVVGLGGGVTDLTTASTGSGTRATSCAAVAGAAKCWGGNSYGQLGNGTSGDPVAAPVQVSGLTSSVTDVSMAASHGCALQNGAVKCWGNNNHGYLGDGTYDDSLTPVQAVGLASGVTDLAVGWRHACAVQGGAVKCWGYNNSGQLGSPGTYTSTPRAVVGLPANVTRIAAGSDFSCAVANGGAWCWGDNGYGQLGANSSASSSTAPLQVVGLTSGVTEISGISNHVCAIRTGAGYCWGRNGNGQLGNGVTVRQGPDSRAPVAVVGLTGLTAIATGRNHSCATASGGSHWCWGTNSWGQLGNEAAGSWSSVPVPAIGSIRVAPPPPPPPPPLPPAPLRASISTPGKAVRVGKTRKATVATISCPAGATCAVTVPKTVTVKIKRKSFKLTVLAPKQIGAGGKASVRVRLSKRAAKRLVGRRTTVTMNVKVVRSGVPLARKITATIKR